MKPKERAKQNDADMYAWLGTPQGRRLFWRLVTQSGAYSLSYATDPHATAFNEGRRSVGLSLLTEAQRVCPERYAQGLREQLDALEQDRPVEPVPED